MKKFIKIYLVMLMVLTTTMGFSQFDPMFTQYMYNESFINPAYAGSHEALSATALARIQWVGINGAPQTQTFNIHTPLANNKLGFGINIFNESIGVQKRTGGALNLAYRIKLKKATLCFGLQGGIVSLSNNLQLVQTITQNDNQFLSNGQRYIAPNFGAGIYYYTKKFYVGLSVPRMLENKAISTSGIENSFKANSFHYYLAMGYVYDVNTQLALKPTIMIKAVKNAPIQFEATVQAIIKNSLWIGVAYRSGDALSGLLGYQISPQFKIGYAYDYTLSSLQKYNTGSHELMLNYIFKYKNKKINTPRYIYQKF